MSDRHIRRSGDEYRDAFLELLPQGQAWPKHTIDSVLWQTCDGLCQYWGTVDGRAADLLERESDPRITMELLPDWERNWGLPDPCYAEPQTIGERQRALVQRMTLWGAQSRQFYIDFAAQLGYGITISEFRTFECGLDRCGDSRVVGDGSNPMFHDNFVRGYLPVYNPNGERIADGELSEWPNYGLGPPENRYYWTVHVHTTSLVWFRCGGGGGQTGIDPHLRIRRAEDLECVLERWKPGHTIIIWDYSGLQPSDPMAGTP
ncbi:YmfQ family protein [Bradyrhizobium elkanii]|uniref:YmfQ family protein n=1 Tax=Bradyrhizobium elkanii TaxID=29448 RepID=UPI000408C968|nr:putative phage tail protein [Bradyrhizobium elkanii]